MKRLSLIGSLLAAGVLVALTGVTLFGQAEPVVAAEDPALLFTDDDPVLHRNKQAAMHVVVDLLGYGHWDEAEKWLTERYIQHNPAFASGRDTVVQAFSGFSTPRPIPADSKDWAVNVVAVVADDDLVTVAFLRENPDPRNPGQTYTTTWFDMWRFVDGKADEHWDYGLIQAPGGGRGKGKGKGK